MRFFFVLAASAFVSCAGGPVEGTACETVNETACGSSTQLLSCEKSAWRGYDCPSCAANQCNWKNAKIGDGCPETQHGRGWCSQNGRQISCYWSSSANAGVFVESSCSKCVEGKTIDEIGGC